MTGAGRAGSTPARRLGGILAAALLASGAGRLSLAAAGPAQGPRFQALVAEARARVRSMDPKTLSAKLARGEKLRVIDVREDSEWAQGRIPGAVHLSKGVIERDIEKEVPDIDAELVLYCGAGGRSVLAADSLRRMGYRRVSDLRGGFQAWRAAGLPQEAP